MTLPATEYGPGFGCIAPPKLTFRETKVLLVRADVGPSEIHCKDCGNLWMPFVLGMELLCPVKQKHYRTDLWICWVCDKAVEVRYADWMPQTGATEDA